MQLWMMKMMHHWFGVGFAAFFFVICLSGVGVTVTEQIVPSVFKSEFRGQLTPISAQGAGQAVKRIDSQGPAALIRLEFPVKGRAVYEAHFADGSASFFDQSDYSHLGSAERKGLSGGLWNMHSNLLNLFGVGRAIVLWTGLIGVYLAVLGVLIFVPQWRGFRRKDILRPKSLRFVDMRRSHMSSGIVFGIFVAFFGFSGWAIGEPDARLLLSGANTGGANTGGADRQDVAAIAPAPSGDIATMVTEAMSKAASDNRLSVRPVRLTVSESEGGAETDSGNAAQAVVHMSVQGDLSLAGHYRAVFDMQTGALSEWQDGRRAGRGARIYGAMEALHTGESLPLIYKLVLAMLGIISGFIALTGLTSYVLKWKMKLSRMLQKWRSKRAVKAPKP